jgi:hypothetical protein
MKLDDPVTALKERKWLQPFSGRIIYREEFGHGG